MLAALPKQPVDNVIDFTQYRTAKNVTTEELEAELKRIQIEAENEVRKLKALQRQHLQIVR
jgi:hypothetical protein